MADVHRRSSATTTRVRRAGPRHARWRASNHRWHRRCRTDRPAARRPRRFPRHAIRARARPMAPAKGHGNRMSQQTTIRKLAALVNTPVDKLLEQLAEAGMKFDDTDQVRSEEHTSELQSLMRISYAVFCLKKKKR